MRCDVCGHSRTVKPVYTDGGPIVCEPCFYRYYARPVPPVTTTMREQRIARNAHRAADIDMQTH